MKDIFEFFVVACLSLVAVSVAYVMFIVMPVSLYNEAECLRKGYPKAEVTIGLERYCMTLDGAVTVRVDKASR